MTDANLLKFSVLYPETVNFPADTNKDGFINEKNNIKYAGYFYDGETGLYYLNARFYDPETARFIQEDTYSGNILDPLSLNLYTYGHNNPISYYDPTGHSIKSIIKSVGNTVKKAVNTVKTVVTAAKPIVNAVKNNAVTTARLVSKQTLNTGLAPVIKAVQNSTQNSRESYQTKLNNYKESGSAKKMVGTFYQGVIDIADNMVSALYNLCDDPLGTAMESVCYFCSDPLKNNPVGAVRQYCSDVSKSIKEQDWNTVSYKLGQGFFNTAAVVPGAKVTKGTVPGKVSSGSGIGSSVRNSLNSMFDGTPALAGTNGMVIAGAAVSAEASIASSAVSGAAGVRVGVIAGAAVGSGIYYSSNGSNQSSGGESSLNSANSIGKTKVILPSKPNKNGTAGHWETILDEVEVMKKSGNYKKIYVNQSLSKEIPGAKPNIRPDIMIDQVEVPSKTDDILALRRRMQDNNRILGDRAGTIKIREIEK